MDMCGGRSPAAFQGMGQALSVWWTLALAQEHGLAG